MKINHKITENQYMAIIHATMIAIGILSLPQGVAAKAHQQGWIPVIIGGVYPIFIVLSSCYIDKKMNHIDFFELNKKLYGGFLAHINTFFFFAYLLFVMTSVIGGFANVLNATFANFIPPSIIIAVMVFVVIYSSIDGLTVIGRICEITFYVGLLIITIFIVFIPKGNIVNIQPLVPSYKEILSAIPTSLFAYTGTEMSFIVIPFVVNRKKLKKAALLGTSTVIFIYGFTVFIAIYYLGWKLCSEINRPLIYMLSTLTIPIIEDLTVIFFFLWSSIILRILACYSFSSAYCLTKIFKIDYIKSCIICNILAGSLSFFFIPEYIRRKLTNDVIVYMVIGSLLWTIVTLILVCIKQRSEKHCQ